MLIASLRRSAARTIRWRRVSGRGGFRNSAASARLARISLSSSGPPGSAARRWTMCCSPVRRVWVRPPWPRSWRANWPSTSARPPGRCLRGPATSPPSSPISSRATTRSGLITTPLRDRFGIPIRLNFYSADELVSIVERGARVLGLSLTADGAREIAGRARGTPRIAGRLLKRVRDFAGVSGASTIDARVADEALTRLEVDKRGLDAFDPRYLSLIADSFGGGPVGIETIAAALGEARDAIEEIVEPFLLQQGFVQRTPRGRVLSGAAFAHLGLPAPPRDPSQFGLFNGEESAP